MKLSIAEGKLTLHVRGADKLWAFKSSLEIALVHITGVRADPEAARGWYHGIRMPGTNVPGVITHYNELVVEVDDPEAAVGLILNAL